MTHMASVSWAAFLYLALALASCSRDDPRYISVSSDFNTQLGAKGELTFVSWGGKLRGMDSDTKLIFLKQDTVVMVEYGIAVARYLGSYEINEGGIVTCTFAGYKDFPEMRLGKSGRALCLFATEEGSFPMGNRGGATMSDIGVEFWPLIQIQP